MTPGGPRCPAFSFVESACRTCRADRASLLPPKILEPVRRQRRVDHVGRARHVPARPCGRVHRQQRCMASLPCIFPWIILFLGIGNHFYSRLVGVLSGLLFLLVGFLLFRVLRGPPLAASPAATQAASIFARKEGSPPRQRSKLLQGFSFWSPSITLRTDGRSTKVGGCGAHAAAMRGPAAPLSNRRPGEPVRSGSSPVRIARWDLQIFGVG